MTATLRRISLYGCYFNTGCRIYGHVSMEVYGHLAHAVERGDALFEATLAELTGRFAPERT